MTTRTKLPKIPESVKVVVNIKSGVSRSGESYHTIEMVDAVTGLYCYTYVVEDYENYKWWKPIVDAYSPFDAPLISGEFHMKKCPKSSKNILVNADSRPRFENLVLHREEYLQAFYAMYFANKPLCTA